jgi:hypothetical protein
MTLIQLLRAHEQIQGDSKSSNSPFYTVPAAHLLQSLCMQ